MQPTAPGPRLGTALSPPVANAKDHLNKPTLTCTFTASAPLPALVQVRDRRPVRDANACGRQATRTAVRAADSAAAAPLPAEPDCATRRSALSQTSASSSRKPPARLRVVMETRRGPGAGRQRTCTVSSTVGTQPDRPSSKAVGGSASTARSSEKGSASRPSARPNQERISPLPDGDPRAQPRVAGSSLSISRSVMAELPETGAGPSSGPKHWSMGGIAGGLAVVRTSSGRLSRSPYEASTRIRSTSRPWSSYWNRDAWPVERVRPVRTTSVRTTAGPGWDAVR